MPDISMCKNEKCPLRLKCFRYMAVPYEYQAYAGFEYDNGCDYFMEIKENK